MLPDPQFSDTPLNTVRLSDPVTSAGWTLGSGQAQIVAGSGNATLALMPSTGPSMWVNPGEQYYLSMTVATTGSRTVDMSAHTDNGTVSISGTVTSGPAQTISGVVTIPSGAHSAYINLFVTSGTAATVTLSNLVCQPATLNAPSLVLFGSDGELLVYSGTPANGNLIASVSGASGTDDESNTYPAGLRITGTSGGSVTIDPTANSGIPYVQFTPKGATHINFPPQAYAGGINLGAANEVEALYLTSGQSQSAANTNSALQLFSDAANSSTGGAYVNFVIDGANTSLTSTVVNGYLPVTQTDTGTNTAGNTTPVDISHAYTIPANDASVGTVYEIEVPFTGTWEGTVLNLGAEFNGSTFVNITPVIASAFTTGHGFVGTMRIKFTVTAVGSSGTVNLDLDGTVTDSSVDRGPSTSFTLNGHHSGQTLNTTVSNTVALAAEWVSNAGAPSVAGITSKFTRIGP